MKLLRRIIPAMIILTASAAWGYGRYYPLDVLKLYAEFKASGCTKCGVKMLDKAALKLDKIFTVGLVIEPGTAGFVKTGRCGDNELQLKTDEKRKVFKNSGDTIIYYPAVVFRFHTESRDMAGINNKDYTDKKYAVVYDSGNVFTAKIKLIRYENGDGKTFVYDRERNVVQVHCRIINLKIASGN